VDGVDLLDRVDVLEPQETEPERQLAATKFTSSTDVRSVHLWPWIECSPTSSILAASRFNSLLLTALAIAGVTL
jgi:hypothetical protein